MDILFLDRNLPLGRFPSRIWTIFSCRNGFFSPLERCRRSYPDSKIFYFHEDPSYESLASNLMEVFPSRSHPSKGILSLCLDALLDPLFEYFDVIIDSLTLHPNRVLNCLAQQIAKDYKEVACVNSDFIPLLEDIKNVSILGSNSELLVHKDACIYPGVIFDTRNGVIAIDDGAEIGQFSYISGPAYIGKNTHVDNCRIVGPSVIGSNCRVGGEIEASVFGDFSNKHHEGFLGHSFVGRWVNLGALTTTSDLKNNYGVVKLAVPTNFFNSSGEPPCQVTTDTIKFGSIVSDCSKIGIGTMINTGSVIDVGCNLFSMEIPKYVPPYTWGNSGKRYDIERFCADCETIFSRRGQRPTDGFLEMARYIWNKSS